MVWTNNTKGNRPQDVMSVPDLLDYRENSAVEIASLTFDDFNLTMGDQPERVPGTMVSANFFSLLGVQPRLGRTFLPHEDQAGADRVVIISDGLWKRIFGGDQSLVNQSIQINGASYGGRSRASRVSITGKGR
jgi:putative ABC transport system permease protein